MKQWKKIVRVVTVCMVVTLWYNPAALAQNVLAGVDLWETRTGDATFNFGGGAACPPIPADFFGPGSDPFDGVVAFQGQPLPTIPPDILGSVDTIVERLGDATLPSCPSSDTIAIEIIALNLVSTEPITVTYGGMQDPEEWYVQMCLSSVTPQPTTGSKTINKDCDEGGTFNALIPLIPKFIFTKVDEPSTQWFIDYGDWGLDPIIYEIIIDGHWLYDDPGFNVITSPGGVVVDHDCDGTADVAVGPGSNFYPGLQAVPCDCQSEPANYNMVQTLWQSQGCGNHGVYPPQAEPQPTIEPQIATECPEVTTECPAIETVCPEWGDTYCPELVTVCPKVETICANEWTYCPEEITWCPVWYTECPMEPTFCTLAQTLCELTMCEYIPTFCPYDETFCPIEGMFTYCPYNYTWCPGDVPTECPMDWTNCPAIPTVCPESFTVCPEVITECPTSPTFCTTTDTDGDGINDCLDNCIYTPNGYLLGTCAEAIGPLYKGTGVTCNSGGDCGTGEVCQKNQEDCNSNGAGDVCECYADFDGDGNVYPSDLSVFLGEYGRTDCLTTPPPCQADFDNDGNVYPSDLSLFLQEYGRTDCPPTI